ncbi:MAG: hypothetical protein ACJ8OJ_18390 [Povalibacter sp.]
MSESLCSFSLAVLGAHGTVSWDYSEDTGEHIIRQSSIAGETAGEFVNYVAWQP